MKKITKCLNFTWFLPEKLSEYPNFYDIARKINKMPEYYIIFARKIPEFFIIIVRKKRYFFLNFGAHVPLPPSPTFMFERRQRGWWRHKIRQTIPRVGSRSQGRREHRRWTSESVERSMRGVYCIYSVSQKSPSDVFWHFPKRLKFFSPNFTRLLHVPVYAGLQIFIQLSPLATKLCHIKCNHPACVSADGGHFEHGVNCVVAINMA